jgi:transcription initiation factor IIE alpha subunit
MMPGGHPTTMERQVAAETLAAALSPLSVRAIQRRLERILLDDRELLISLQCQLEQIRRELRLLNDERIVSALGGIDPPISH